ncbi:MAG: VRR-NUC domain-containing protein [Gammaproteobacteria bacterium]
MSEHDHQVALFEWADYQTGMYPELAFMYAIPNGGHRHKATAGKMKAEGQKAGVLDIHLPVARGGYIGLWVEMKFGSNGPTQEQKAWLVAMRTFGHRAVVCHDWEDAKAIIEEYLNEA